VSGCVGKVCSTPSVCKISFLNEITHNSPALFEKKKSSTTFPDFLTNSIQEFGLCNYSVLSTTTLLKMALSLCLNYFKG